MKIINFELPHNTEAADNGLEAEASLSWAHDRDKATRAERLKRRYPGRASYSVKPPDQTLIGVQ